MDLKAATLADLKARRLTRAGMTICFIIAGGMLLASLAMAHGTKSQHLANDTLYSSIPHSSIPR